MSSAPREVKLEPRERTVLDQVADCQLGQGTPVPVNEVLLALPHELMDLARGAIEALIAKGCLALLPEVVS